MLLEDGDGLREVDSEGLYHGGWAFRREAFCRVRGYGPHNNGEDQELAGRLNEAGLKSCDPCTFAEPFYIYRYDNCSYHLSYMDDSGYRSLGDGDVSKCQVQIGWLRDYDRLPVKRRFTFAPHVNPTSDKPRVELIGPVDAPGGNGPSNGMYALQKALRKRIDEGLDWLSIKSLPASRDAIPWFWNWADRRYAAWWDSQGLPFIQGPNMLFLNSATPRIDAEECALLDAANCRAMFCHSEWYRDLIAKHRGPANQSPIVMWPYPIDPWPGEPLPDEYDLLIYAKNGHRPMLLEHLAELFPRHIQIHYGRIIARSSSRLPVARGRVLTWPTTITGRWPCRKFSRWLSHGGSPHRGIVREDRRNRRIGGPIATGTAVRGNGRRRASAGGLYGCNRSSPVDRPETVRNRASELFANGVSPTKSSLRWRAFEGQWVAT